jgi:hypothetical protein
MAQSERGIALLGRQELLEETSLVAVIERRLPNRSALISQPFAVRLLCCPGRQRGDGGERGCTHQK